MVAERVVFPVGENFTAMLQAAPGMSGFGQTFVWLKNAAPVPENTMLPSVTLAVPVFEAATLVNTGPP